jgi:glycosyltransferase involved in cell wall biosynthesis
VPVDSTGGRLFVYIRVDAEDGAMAPLDVLAVGPVDRAAGGISRYLDEQRRRLPAAVALRTHDDGSGRFEWGPVRTLLSSLRAALAFPLRARPDVVHVHASHGPSFYRASWYVLVAALVWRRPAVVHVHGSSFDEFATTDAVGARAIQWLAFGLADRVVVLSAGWADRLAGRVDRGKLVVVPNAVDPDEYDPDPADPPVVAFVSSQIERKGIREFVAALDRVDGEFEVAIAGTGPLSELSADLAERDDRVEYLEYVSESRKRELLERATLYVLPTHAEGLPIALLEGMAGGNAVLTTDVGAIPEVLDDRSGWVVSPGDVDALVEALSAFVEDPEAAVEMGRHNRRIVEEEYAWSVVVGRLTGLYRSLAGVEERPGDPAVVRED